MTETGNQIIDPMIRELMETAAIGEAAKLFLQSKLGEYVAHKAADDVERAIVDLCEVDPEDAKAVRALQAQINTAKNSIIYLTDAMSAGEHAMQQLADED